MARGRDADVPWILMHWRGHSRPMDALAVYDDVVTEVRDELRARVDAAVAAGVDPSALVLDPGLGFAKRAGHNWALLRRLEELRELGFPVLVGASRKRFLGTLLASKEGTPRPPDGREEATARSRRWWPPPALGGAGARRTRSLDAVAVCRSRCRRTERMLTGSR